MDNGDANVVLNMLGSLANVATADATTLDNVPIRNGSKELISRFFGASGSNHAGSNTPVEEGKMEAKSNDLVECADSSAANGTNQKPSYQTPFPSRDFQMETNGPMVQNHQSFSGDADFTLMASSRQPDMHQPGYDAAPSIFPESFAQQNHFPQPPVTGGYRQMTINHPQYGFSADYPNEMHGAGTSASSGFHQQHLPRPSGSRAGGNYQTYQHGAGRIPAYQDTNQGYGRYSQSARYHPQQFM